MVGVGLILPVQNTMERPEEMPGTVLEQIFCLNIFLLTITYKRVRFLRIHLNDLLSSMSLGMLQTTILFLTVLFIAIGAISYMAFGAATADMVQTFFMLFDGLLMVPSSLSVKFDEIITNF